MNQAQSTSKTADLARFAVANADSKESSKTVMWPSFLPILGDLP
jgi:hypothetical protein